jgi:TolB protein
MIQQPPEERQDPTVSNLLLHIREMRDAVPVNQKLKQELKKKLMAQMAQYEPEENAARPIRNVNRRTGWIITGSVILTLLILVIAVWGNNSGDRQFLPLKGVQSDEAAWSPDGKEFALIHQHEVWLYDEKGRKLKSILLPGKGQIIQIRYSPREKELGVLEQEGGMTTIWSVALTTGGVQLVRIGSSSHLKGLQF